MGNIKAMPKRLVGALMALLVAMGICGVASTLTAERAWAAATSANSGQALATAIGNGAEYSQNTNTVYVNGSARANQAIDFSGTCNLVVNGTLTLPTDNQDGLRIQGGTLTISGSGTITNTTGSKSMATIKTMGGSLIIDGVTITGSAGGGMDNSPAVASGGGSITMNSGTLTGPCNTLWIDAGSNTQTTINGGTITSSAFNANFGNAITNNQGNTLTVNGGTITGYQNGIANGGTLTVNGGTITAKEIGQQQYWGCGICNWVAADGGSKNGAVDVKGGIISGQYSFNSGGTDGSFTIDGGAFLSSQYYQAGASQAVPNVKGGAFASGVKINNADPSTFFSSSTGVAEGTLSYNNTSVTAYGNITEAGQYRAISGSQFQALGQNVKLENDTGQPITVGTQTVQPGAITWGAGSTNQGNRPHWGGGSSAPTGPTTVAGFSDVLSNAWYANDVAIANLHGLMVGWVNDKGQKVFGPADPLTRAEAATILWRYAEPEEASSYDASTAVNTTPWTDAQSHQFYTGALNWAYDNDVLNGYAGSNLTGPDDPLTREQMCAILYNFSTTRYDVSTDGANPSSYSTASDQQSVSSWAQDVVGWAFHNDIMTGKQPGNVLAATDVTNRAEGAKMFVYTLGGLIGWDK